MATEMAFMPPDDCSTPIDGRPADPRTGAQAGDDRAGRARPVRRRQKICFSDGGVLNVDLVLLDQSLGTRSRGGRMSAFWPFSGSNDWLLLGCGLAANGKIPHYARS